MDTNCKNPSNNSNVNLNNDGKSVGDQKDKNSGTNTSPVSPQEIPKVLRSCSSATKKSVKFQDVKTVKCLLIGDNHVGKTALVESFLFEDFNRDYIPTARDDYTFCTTLGGMGTGTVSMDIDLDICDTGGRGDLDRLRPLCYGKAEVVIICFSVVVPSSYANVMNKWIPELKRHCLNFKSMKTILVGTQSDLRSNLNILLHLMDDGLAPISETRALRLAKKIGAIKYVECSSVNKYNIKKVFEIAMTPTPTLNPTVPNAPNLLKGTSDRTQLFWRRWRLRQKSSNKIKRLMFLSCIFQ